MIIDLGEREKKNYGNKTRTKTKSIKLRMSKKINQIMWKSNVKRQKESKNLLKIQNVYQKYHRHIAQCAYISVV